MDNIVLFQVELGWTLPETGEWKETTSIAK